MVGGICGSVWEDWELVYHSLAFSAMSFMDVSLVVEIIAMTSISYLLLFCCIFGRVIFECLVSGRWNCPLALLELLRLRLV